MNLSDRIAGFERPTDQMDALLYQRTVEAQKVRVSHAQHVLPQLAVISGPTVYGLWNQTLQGTLVLWIFLILASVSARALVCRHIARTLPNINPLQLYRNEISLFIPSLASAVAVGLGFWLVAVFGTDRAMFAVTLLSCMYAIGTTIYTSMQLTSFFIVLTANLGQGIVFLAFVKAPADIEAAVVLTGILSVLLRFGRHNSALFTESIRMREENRQQNQQLKQDRLLIEKSLAAARAANNEKSRFLAAASHDLRQPLHAMTLFLGSLRHISTDNRAIELSDKIDETGNLLRDQFNSLLDLSKFDAGVVEAEYSQFRLDEMLGRIHDEVLPDAQRKHLDVHLDVFPVSVISDSLLLERLLRNLIVNAVRFTEQGSVTIRTRQINADLSVEISDTGPGIAPEDQERIFQDFYQLHNSARNHDKGSGLGLAIARRISDLLGLKLSVSSKPGQGATFSVQFPAHAVLQNQSETVDVLPMPDLRSMVDINVLVVDDNPQVLDAMTGLLKTWGCKTYYAANATQVWELVDPDKNAMSTGQTCLDLVILDFMLDGETSGLDIAQRLMQWLPHQRILITTGHVEHSNLAEMHASGFEVLIKPVDPFQLRRIMSRALDTRFTTPS